MADTRLAHRAGGHAASSRHSRRGDHEAAERADEKLEHLSRPFLFGRHTAWRARVAALRGDPERTVRLLARSFAEGQPFGVDLHADPDLEPLRGLDSFSRMLRPKG